MAFDQSNLGKLAGSDGFTLWRYTDSASTGAQIAAANYFDGVSDNMFRVGDVILAQGSDTSVALTLTKADPGDVVVGEPIDLVTAVEGGS